VRILEVSALPVWSMAGKGGMPSLRETLRGHERAGFDIALILPQYHLFADRLEQVSRGEGLSLEVYLARMPWFPALHAARQVCKRVCGGGLPTPARWVLNLLTFLLLTGSFLRVAFRLRYRGRRRFDLVYAHSQYASLAGWIVGRLFRAPNVTRLYGTFLADLMRKPLVSLRYPVAAAGFRVPSDRIICTNDGTRGDEVARALRIAPERFCFWQNGLDLPDKPPHEDRRQLAERLKVSGLRQEAKWVVSCSRLSYWKRIDRMIEALRQARHAGCDCQLVLAGEGGERAKLQALARQLGVGDDAVWLGAVAHDDVWALMHAADLFMITNDVTNRCNPLYEAIASGLPVVSVEDPSTADLLSHEDNALLASRDDPEALGRCLIRICGDSRLAERMGQAQRRRAEGLWSWHERMAVEVKELRALVAGHRADDARENRR